MFEPSRLLEFPIKNQPSPTILEAWEGQGKWPREAGWRDGAKFVLAASPSEPLAP